MDGIFDVNIPPVTQAMLVCSAALAIGVSTGFFSEQMLAFIPARVAEGELWRPFTALFFVSPFNSHFCIMWTAYVSCSRWLEETYYPTTRGYLWRLMLMTLYAVTTSVCGGTKFPSEIILYAIVYLTSRRNPAHMQFLHVIPWEFSMYHTLMMAMLVEPHRVLVVVYSIVLGHALLVLEDILPQWTNQRILALDGEPAPFI